MITTVDFYAYQQQVEITQALQACAMIVLDTGRNDEAAYQVLAEVSVRLSQMQDEFAELDAEQSGE